jgi:hypothetical protein
LRTLTTNSVLSPSRGDHSAERQLCAVAVERNHSLRALAIDEYPEDNNAPCQKYDQSRNHYRHLHAITKGTLF